MTETVYTYDDITLGPPLFPEAILYDEPCFFYDGGYDLICLQGINKLPLRKKKRGIGGRSTLSTQAKKTYPEADFVELVFKTSIVDFEKEKTTTYKVSKKNDLSVKVHDFSIGTKRSLVTSEIIKRVGITKLKISSDIMPKK